MKPATELILRALAAHLKTQPEVGQVILGGFEQIPGGKELVDRLVKNKLLCVVNFLPVTWTEPTQATRAFARWQEQVSISVFTIRRLTEGAAPWDARFADAAWVASVTAEFCDGLAEPNGVQARALAELGVGIVRATMMESDYAPGEGADLAEGFISTGASFVVFAEVVKT